jgi:aryl-alcohol dehydrogenase-like predicted oxidoreductase
MSFILMASSRSRSPSGVASTPRFSGEIMRYKLLGQTGLYVSELCLGTMTFGNKGFWEVMGGLQADAARELVKTAFDAGINFIDTANVYSLGDSELLLGQAIKTLGLPRDELIVATKATGIMNDRPNGRGHSRVHLMNELDASLRRLQLDHIDLYQLHGVDPLTPLEDTLGTLNDMVRSGKVRYIGLCNMPAWQIVKALAISERRGWSRFDSVQAYYTIAGRDLEREVVPMLQDQKLGLMVWSPLAGGLLSGQWSAQALAPAGTRNSIFRWSIKPAPSRSSTPCGRSRKNTASPWRKSPWRGCSGGRRSPRSSSAPRLSSS